MKKMNIVEAIVARLKGGNESKIKQFIDKGVRIANNNIAIAEAKIKEYNAEYDEKVIDAKDTALEVLTTIDLTRINNADDRSAYFKEYASEVLKADDAHIDLKERRDLLIKECNQSIESNKRLLELWESVDISNILCIDSDIEVSTK